MTEIRLSKVNMGLTSLFILDFPKNFFHSEGKPPTVMEHLKKYFNIESISLQRTESEKTDVAVKAWRLLLQIKYVRAILKMKRAPIDG